MILSTNTYKFDQNVQDGCMEKATSNAILEKKY